MSIHYLVSLAIAVFQQCNRVGVICLSEWKTCNGSSSISLQLRLQIRKLLDPTQVGVGMDCHVDKSQNVNQFKRVSRECGKTDVGKLLVVLIGWSHMSCDC